MGSILKKVIKVHCPNCSNKRLFDCGTTAEGIVSIKCPSCKSVVMINLHHVTVHNSANELAY